MTATRPLPKFRMPGCSSARVPTTTSSRTSLKSVGVSSTGPRPRPGAPTPRVDVAVVLPPRVGAVLPAGVLGAPEVVPGGGDDVVVALVPATAGVAAAVGDPLDPDVGGPIALGAGGSAGAGAG